jgi:N-acetylmuramoyl-L-alanine amidase
MFTATNHARRLLTCSLLLALVLAGAMPAAAATNDTIAGLSVTPIHYGASAGSAKIQLSLRRTARVTVTIRRPNGTVVRTLASNASLGSGVRQWRWDGRNNTGTKVSDGRYKVKVAAANSRGKASAGRAFRKGLPLIYPARPGALVVSIDPGHGGHHWGAYYKGSHEKTFNLDIALRLRGLLQAAGVKVVLTRNTDSVVNADGRDVNGDGKVTKADELASRLDIANQARADLHLSIHNNSATCSCVRGTETYTSRRRTWSPEGQFLATVLHRQQLSALDTFRSPTFWPVDRGIKSGSFYAMEPYSDWRPRPSLMPTVLTESLFVNNDIELTLLRRSDVRQSLAAAFYVGIADYFSRRDYGIGYRLIGQPSSPVTAGATARYVVRVTNRGNRRSSGWALELRAARRVPLYDGSDNLGALIGSKRLPDGLAPGQSVDVSVDVTAPSKGEWLVKAGLHVGGSDRPHLSQRGVPVLQTSLRTR